MNRNLTLIFGEDGLRTQYRIGTDINTQISPELSARYKCPVFSTVTGDLPDVALFTSYFAYRIERAAGFMFNNTVTIIEEKDLEGTKPLNEQQQANVLARFENVSGTGPLTDEQKITIGAMAGLAMNIWEQQRPEAR